MEVLLLQLQEPQGENGAICAEELIKVSILPDEGKSF